MLTDEHEHAMKVWREACGESQEAFYRIGEQPNDPESIKQGQLADQAAAAVIAADRAGLVAEIEAEVARLREALVATEGAIAEYYRYWTGGEMRGSYDGKPERASLWKSRQTARAALGASRDA